MISLQSAEEGEEAGVRGRVGQKLLDLSMKLKENLFVTFITYSTLRMKSIMTCLQEQDGSFMCKINVPHLGLITSA